MASVRSRSCPPAWRWCVVHAGLQGTDGEEACTTCRMHGTVCCPAGPALGRARCAAAQAGPATLTARTWLSTVSDLNATSTIMR